MHLSQQALNPGRKIGLVLTCGLEGGALSCKRRSGEGVLRPWRKGAAPHPGREPPLGALHARRSPFPIFPRLNARGCIYPGKLPWRAKNWRTRSQPCCGVAGSTPEGQQSSPSSVPGSPEPCRSQQGLGSSSAPWLLSCPAPKCEGAWKERAARGAAS